MKVIFHYKEPLGKISIKMSDSEPKILITRNDLLLEEGPDYSLFEKIDEKEITIIQDFGNGNGKETTIQSPSK